MDGFGTLQAWLVIGVPVLGLCVGLLLTRKPAAALFALGLLAAAFVALALVDRVSAAVFGTLLALLYAAGRGGPAESAGELAAGERTDSDAWRYSDTAEAGASRR